MWAICIQPLENYFRLPSPLPITTTTNLRRAPPLPLLLEKTHVIHVLIQKNANPKIHSRHQSYLKNQIHKLIHDIKFINQY